MGVSEQPLLSKPVLEGPCLVRMLKLRREAYFINWCQFLLQMPFLSTEAQVCRWEHWIHVQNEAAVKRTWSRVLGLDVGHLTSGPSRNKQAQCENQRRSCSSVVPGLSRGTYCPLILISVRQHLRCGSASCVRDSNPAAHCLKFIQGKWLCFRLSHHILGNIVTATHRLPPLILMSQGCNVVLHLMHESFTVLQAHLWNN